MVCFLLLLLIKSSEVFQKIFMENYGDVKHLEIQQYMLFEFCDFHLGISFLFQWKCYVVKYYNET